MFLKPFSLIPNEVHKSLWLLHDKMFRVVGCFSCLLVFPPAVQKNKLPTIMTFSSRGGKKKSRHGVFGLQTWKEM